MYNLGYNDTIFLWYCGGVRAPRSLGLEVPGIWVCILVFFILHSSSYVFFYCITYSPICCIMLRVCKLRMGFSVPSIVWVGVELMQTQCNATHPAWPAKTKLKMALNCSRKAKEIVMMRGIFVEGRRQTLLYSCKRQEQERS